MSLKVIQGDCRTALRELPDKSVHCCVTSPPYFGLRRYLPEGHPMAAREIGQEATPADYVKTMVLVGREVWRVLRDDGTFWLNLGDCYARNGGTGTCGPNALVGNTVSGEKELLGIPWRVAFALQDDGWYLRQDIVWAKPAPMPESVTDRCTRSHEFMFMLTKAPRYYYDCDAIRTDHKEASLERFPDGGEDTDNTKFDKANPQSKRLGNLRNGSNPLHAAGANRRDVWVVASAPLKESHFAPFPPKLVEPCILAGTSARGCCPGCGAPWKRIVEKTSIPDTTAKGSRFDIGKTGWTPTCGCGRADTVPCTVLDPFGGSGTTGKVALELGRSAILCELNPAYLPLIQQRTDVTPGLPL